MKLAGTLALAATLATAACTQSPPQSATDAAATPAAPVEAPAVTESADSPSAQAPATAAVQDLPTVLVHRDPGCGCCEKWVEHMQQAGFTAQMSDDPGIGALKKQLGIPEAKASCHTARIGGYVFEGHVPADDIKRFLAEKPQAKGLLVPGMPIGSPGMEVPGAKPAAYTVERLEADGSTTPYATHGG